MPPDAFARLLQRLAAEGSAPRSQFSARSLQNLQSLFDSGTLRLTRRGSGFVVEVRHAETLATFYRARYPADGERLFGPPRAQAVGLLRNAKRGRQTHAEPILVRAMAPATCSREGVQCDLQAATAQTAATCLVLEDGRFWTLKAKVALVENLECFLHVERMGISAAVALYTAGRLSTLALRWLASPELSGCQFIHCGDYDPVGLDEYLRLKAGLGNRVQLHIPDHLHSLIATYGRPDLLRDSEAVLRRVRQSSDTDVRRVVTALDETGCGLEQEILLLARQTDALIQKPVCRALRAM